MGCPFRGVILCFVVFLNHQTYRFYLFTAVKQKQCNDYYCYFTIESEKETVYSPTTNRNYENSLKNFFLIL